MDQNKVLSIFKKAGVLLEGHFLLTSGKHSRQYLQCAKIFQYPEYSEVLTRDLAECFRNEQIDLVIGPALGGIILSYEMGRCLKVRTIFAERENGVMTLRRGFEIPEGASVLVVEDVVTTGGSVKEVIELVGRHKGIVKGVGSIVDRSNGKVDFGVPFHSVLSMEVESFAPGDCPLCKEGLPSVKPGSRSL